ncbi:hypothetical protein TNCV_1446701 [Trichonephila clavipes]|nr:hypothetical protein TNCV_1446701 [Trichonephila clavipes]
MTRVLQFVSDEIFQEGELLILRLILGQEVRLNEKREEICPSYPLHLLIPQYLLRLLEKVKQMKIFPQETTVRPLYNEVAKSRKKSSFYGKFVI